MKLPVRLLAIATLLLMAWLTVTSAVGAQNPTATDGDTAAEELTTATPIKHLITVMQENHSFDNYFGTYPGVDGLPQGTCMPLASDDPGSDCVRPFHIGDQAIVDLGHSDDVFVEQYADGDMDGFIEVFDDRNAGSGPQTMGFYDDRDLPYYWNLADEYVLFDKFFTSAAGGSVRNHFYWISGAPGNEESDSLRAEGFDDVPTIFDSLQDAGVSWKFYIQNYDPDINFRATVEGSQAGQLIWAPLLNYNRFLDDPDLNSRIVPLDEFYDDLANGTLPAVSYMVPSGASEHPPGSIQAGERFIRSLITSLMRSSAWETSAFTWTYDDWGGWYDHVKPPQVDEFGFGFRAPALLVAAYAKQGYIDSTRLDFTSILKFIEINWDIDPLAPRDARANTFLDAFDFDSPPRDPILLDRRRVIEPARVPRAGVVYASYGTVVSLAVVLLLLTIRRTARAPLPDPDDHDSAASP